MTEERKYLTEEEIDTLISNFRYKINHSDKPKYMAKLMSDFVNSFSCDEETFIKTMSNDHRTIQQSFTKFCFKWIEHCSKDDYRTDGRNENSHQISKEVVNLYSSKKESEYSGWKNVKPSQFLSMV